MAAGQQLATDVAPADRITPERVRAYIADLQAFNSTSTLLFRLQELRDAAAVMNSGRDWRWIRRVAARLRAEHKPARAKRDRMVHARDLLSLGQHLMVTAARQSTARLRAKQFRDGLIIGLLAARPLRAANLAGLEIDRTLETRGDAWWISIPAEETKTRRHDIEIPWPDELVSPLGVYLHEHRQLLCSLRGRCRRPVGNAVWVSTHGSPLTAIAIYNMIVSWTAAAFGRPVNPHLFRDCAATSIAIDDPAHVRIASQILGHRSTATTERYYNQAQAIEAARRYQGFLIGLRQGRMTEDQNPTES